MKNLFLIIGLIFLTGCTTFEMSQEDWDRINDIEDRDREIEDRIREHREDMR